MRLWAVFTRDST